MRTITCLHTRTHATSEQALSLQGTKRATTTLGPNDMRRGCVFLFISTNFVITQTSRSPGPILDPHPCVSTYHHPFTPTTTQFGPTTTRLHPPTPVLDPFTPTTTCLHLPTLLFEPYSPVYTHHHPFIPTHVCFGPPTHVSQLTCISFQIPAPIFEPLQPSFDPFRTPANIFR